MTTAQTYFYVFDQNNSGGYFVIDENVTSEIIIEATEEAKALERLEEILSQNLNIWNTVLVVVSVGIQNTLMFTHVIGLVMSSMKNLKK